MKIYKVIPKLERERILNLWRKAQDAQWSADAIPWKAPKSVNEKANLDRLGRILTPILMSEQSPFHSATALLPLLGQQDEVEAQYYLTTWLVDEARHAELFALLFRRFDREPLSARRFPYAYLFQSQIRSDDTAIWLAGLLVVEVLAKHVMTELRRVDLDPCITEIAHRILADEARHLGFNRIYMEDRLAALGRADGLGDPERVEEGTVGTESDAFVARLQERMELVLESTPKLLGTLAKELDEVGFRRDDVIDAVFPESRQRMERAIGAGLRAAKKPPGSAPPRLGEAEAYGD